ncbi:class I SAM-dependent methyltransferase [Holophaga foetida]|uniref:class I SAM-dependent methyltransferase n=1 Tax=Holophaga foetida TaxID=35839 RepID=UPI000247498D|nr:class I SAM-dependent methyltransferase [Holophaga foetida]
MSDWFSSWFDSDYAALYAHRDEGEAVRAVKTALRLAPELGKGPVMDLGCGGGRHLAALRRHNPLAFGLDLSATLLEAAPKELRGWLLRGDMRAIPVKDGSLWGVCLWFTPFGYFDEAQNRALMARIARLLRPGGILLLDFMNAHLVRRDLVPEEREERSGYRIHIRRNLEGPRVVKRIQLTHLDTGNIREAKESVRVYDPMELVAMARDCGLSLVGEVGDYDGLPFRATASPRWIGIFHRPRV